MMDNKQTFTEKEKAFLAGRAFSKNILSFYPAFSLKDIENAFEAGVKFGRDVMNCPSCSEYLESLRENKGEATKDENEGKITKDGSEPDAVLEMSQHFESDVWEKIVKNYDPFCLVESGRTLKQACEICDTAHEFICQAFNWCKSREGEFYWDEIYTALQEKGL